MKKLSTIFLIVIFLATNIEVANSTFSICAVDPVTGQVGSAGASCIANCLILSYIQPNWGVLIFRLRGDRQITTMHKD